MKNIRGFGIIEIIFIVAAIATLTAIGLALNNWAFHHYVDPEKAKWDKEKEIYVANEKLCAETNARLGNQFTALRQEVDGIAKTFADAAAQQEQNYKDDKARIEQKAKASNPKIDSLRARAAAPSTVNTTELAKCRAAQAMLNDYAVDVQRVREAFGMVDVGPVTRVPTK